VINCASFIFIARVYVRRARELLSVESREIQESCSSNEGFSTFDCLHDDFNLSVIFSVSVPRNDSIGEFAWGENRRLSRQIFDFVYSIFQKNDAAVISGATRRPFNQILSLVVECATSGEKGGGREEGLEGKE